MTGGCRRLQGQVVLAATDARQTVMRARKMLLLCCYDILPHTVVKAAELGRTAS
jgi:hypothetical protein